MISDMPGCVWKCTGCCGKNVANNELIKIIEKLQNIVTSLQDEIKQLKEEKKMEKGGRDTEVLIKREKNLVFYRFETTADDLKNVKDIIKTIAPTIQTNNISVMRMGRPQNNKPAQLKVQLPFRDEVYIILKNKLRDLNINISIST
ncbi:hypothetical protein JTB14_010672 [Gonioctena quinquepunctata]|nr:hypothetical protein JTB14_010672 [Gonioctena quinquepunctata]